MPRRTIRRSANVIARSLAKPERPNTLRKRRVNDLFDHIPARWPEITQYAHDGSSHELRIFRYNPSAAEIAAVASNQIEIGLEDYNDLCYLTSRLTAKGECYRTPIAYWLLPTPRCALPAPGSPLRIILIDASNGTIKAIGKMKIEVSIATRLQQLLTLQAQQPSGYLVMDDLLRSTRS